MRNVIGPILMAVIRAGLQAFAGWMIARGLWSPSESEAWLRGAIDPIVLGSTVFALTLVSSAWNKVKAWVETKLAAESGAPVEAKKITSELSIKEILDELE